jgi:hypothetical protein
VLFGFKYIFQRKPLLSLLLFFITLNFIIGCADPLFSPMVLARTGNNSTALGFVRSSGFIGAVIGGALLTLWGGFKKKMTNILVGEALTGLFLCILYGLGRTVPVWVGVLLVGSIIPVYVNGSSQAIWQSKVPPDLQGRVFSARRMIAWITGPLSPIIAGLLADKVTEPAMQSNTWLAQVFGPLVGNTPGSGMAVQFILSGVMYILCVGVVALWGRNVTTLEATLPDHDQVKTNNEETTNLEVPAESSIQ